MYVFDWPAQLPAGWRYAVLCCVITTVEAGLTYLPSDPAFCPLCLHPNCLTEMKKRLHFVTSHCCLSEHGLSGCWDWKRPCVKKEKKLQDAATGNWKFCTLLFAYNKEKGNNTFISIIAYWICMFSNMGVTTESITDATKSFFTFTKCSQCRSWLSLRGRTLQCLQAEEDKTFKKLHKEMSRFWSALVLPSPIY